MVVRRSNSKGERGEGGRKVSEAAKRALRENTELHGRVAAMTESLQVCITVALVADARESGVVVVVVVAVEAVVVVMVVVLVVMALSLLFLVWTIWCQRILFGSEFLTSRCGLLL